MLKKELDAHDKCLDFPFDSENVLRLNVSTPVLWQLTPLKYI